jgi:hypothetical protein
MSVVITPVEVLEVSVDNIPALRQDVAEAGVRQYGAERRYAEGLLMVLGNSFFTVEHNDTSDTAKPVHSEKAALYKVLKDAKHTNPSTVWARVRKYAEEMVKKAQAQDAVDAGESVGEGEGSGNARHTRSLGLRLIEDLTALYKATKRAESLSNKEQQAQTHIVSALGALGVDVATLK